MTYYMESSAKSLIQSGKEDSNLLIICSETGHTAHLTVTDVHATVASA